MEDINLDDYDLSYELQYMQLFTKLLEPYIKFENIQTRIEPHLNIYLIKGCGRLQLLNRKNFVYYLQIDFPRIMYQKMKQIKDEIETEIKNQKKFMNITHHNSRGGLSVPEYSKKKKYYSEEYDKNRQNLRNKLEKLKTISNLNKEFHGKVDGVLHFIKLIETYSFNLNV
ncbi:MAG: hypothetical protein CMD29_05350 [Flavobacteriales bacterium]|mgnify:CR=1 FL=1|nr:hypothetical protein [Flavobacteriales bacterium]